MSSTIEPSTDMDNFNFRDNFLLGDATLDIEKILLKFQEFMKLQHSSKNTEFLEKDGRLVFLTFLKPIINGAASTLKKSRSAKKNDWILS